MSEQIIIEIIKGIFATIVALITAYGAFLGAKIFKHKKYSKINLNKHPIFARADLNKNILLTYFSLENKGKEIIFKDILVNHMDIYKKHTETLCNATKEIEDSNQLYTVSVNTMNKIIHDLRTFYKDNNSYSTKDIEVLDIVISKYNNWDYDREIEVITRIQEICGSAFYPDIYTKAVAILDSFLFAMNDTVSAANRTLNSLNGDLKGLSFKGVEI